jgi:hypothetical protein
MSETDPLFQAAYFIKTVASHVNDATAERDRLLAERDQLRAAVTELINMARSAWTAWDDEVDPPRHIWPRLAELQRLVTP